MRLPTQVLVALVSFVLPAVASAHEVYVLKPDEITLAVHNSSPDPFLAALMQPGLFAMWAVIIVALLAAIWWLSSRPVLMKVCDPFLLRIKPAAPFVARITLGLAFIFSGYYHSFFGPELGIAHVVGSATASFDSILLIVLGVCIIFGLFTRIAAVIGLILFAINIFDEGWYMLTYVNYLGEIILFLILGGGAWSLDRRVSFLARIERHLGKMFGWLEQYSFLILRILFGISLIYASAYAKFLHSNLAIMTVVDFHLTNFFPFQPLFLVLGAFLIEMLIGVCIMIGLEIRFISIFFLTFLTMSVLYFGESVWPHIILFGVGIVLFIHGYDDYMIGNRLYKKRRGELVL